jgi:hypothetical protein
MEIQMKRLSSVIHRKKKTFEGDEGKWPRTFFLPLFCLFSSLSFSSGHHANHVRCCTNETRIAGDEMTAFIEVERGALSSFRAIFFLLRFSFLFFPSPFSVLSRYGHTPL